MSTTVNMDLNIVARGMNTLVDQSAQFNRNMQSGATAGGTAGSRALAARAENQDYNRARGVGSGSTGSSTSDFARQASGLGGLVHVYATFAANLFAAEAAFMSLSKAMDTSNLVKGLDQLGAASGKNLTSLAKNMVTVADGAISLKQAMSSTAMASSGGMSAKDIERMTAVAKNASLALGRDMTDSMDRLTKGIVKIQPELLDELGIMARVIPAQQEYARNIGKSVSSLTDFEKRQAFTNAVLAEGEKKFGAIDLVSNPYSKLTSSASNLLQTGLELLNKVLAPTVKILSESPAALATVMGGIGLMLLNKAIPAIGQWREGLKAAAVEAERTAARINTAYMEFDIARRLGPAQQVADVATRQANESISKVQTIIGQSFSKNSKLFKSVMSGSYDAAEGQDAIDRQAKSAETRLKTLEEARRLTTSTDAAHLASLDAGIAKQKTQLDNIKLAAAENIIAAQKQAEAHNVMEAAAQGAGAAPRWGTPAWQREQNAKRASDKAQSMQILSNVGTNTQTMGAVAAFKELLTDLSQGAQRFDENGKAVDRYTDKLGTLSKGITFTKGIFTIMMSSIGTALGAFSNVAQAVGAVVAIFEILDAKFSKNSQQVEDFSNAFNSLNSSAKIVTDTLDSMSKKKPLERLSVESNQAIANSFKGLSDSITDTTNTFLKAKDAANDWDKRRDSIKSMFGAGLSDSMSEGISKSINASLKILGSSQEANDYKNKVSEIFGTSAFDVKSIKKEFESLDDATKAVKLKEFIKYEEELSNKTNIAASKLTSFKDSLNALGKANQDLLNTFQNTDPLSKVGNSLLAVASAMQNIVNNGEDSQKAILELMKNTDALSAIGGDFATKLLDIRGEFERNSAAAKDFSDKISTLKDEITKLQAEDKSSKTGIVPSIRKMLGLDALGYGGEAEAGKSRASDMASANKRMKFMSDQQIDANTAKDNLTSLQQRAQKLLSEGLQDAFVKGAKLIDAALGLSSQKVALTISKGLLSGLSGTAALDAQKLLTEKEASIQKQLIEANYQQVSASNKLAAVMEGLALQERLKVEKAKPESQQNSALISQLETSIDANDSVKKILEGTPKGIAEAVEKGLKTTDAGSKDAIVGRALLPQYQLQKGKAAKLAEAGAASAALSAEQAGTRPVAEFTEGRKAALNYQKELLSVQLNSLSVQDKLLGYTTDSNMEAKQILEREISRNEAMQSEGQLAAELEGIYAKIAKTANSKEAEILGAEAATKKESLERLKILNIKKQENQLDNQSADLLLLKLQNERELAKLKAGPERLAAQRELDIAQDLVTAKQEQLDYAKGQGRLGDDAYDSATKAAKLEEARIKRQSTLNKATEAYLDKINEIRDRLITNPNDERAQADATAQGASYMDAVEAANREYNARSRNLDLVYSQTAAERELEKAVNGTAATLTDAFFDATQSGKYNFGDMINSMLTDLAKLEFRMYMMQQLSIATGGQGLFGALGIGKWFGGSTAGIEGSADFVGPLLPKAKGAAYDQGIQKFANGGAFTNSVVASPTLFKFAKGTGLMGEAGPEAIMPLQRDNSGRLGVAVNGGGTGVGTATQVVVNNYSTAQATATESVDSRGQRRVEVTIGNMVAGEIMRPGSSAQQSIKNTFGRAPQLIRR